MGKIALSQTAKKNAHFYKNDTEALGERLRPSSFFAGGRRELASERRARKKKRPMKHRSPVAKVIPERLERSTHSLEGCCSIQLSYGTIGLRRFPAAMRGRRYEKKSNSGHLSEFDFSAIYFAERNILSTFAGFIARKGERLINQITNFIANGC